MNKQEGSKNASDKDDFKHCGEKRTIERTDSEAPPTKRHKGEVGKEGEAVKSDVKKLIKGRLERMKALIHDLGFEFIEQESITNGFKLKTPYSMGLLIKNKKGHKLGTCFVGYIKHMDKNMKYKDYIARFFSKQQAFGNVRGLCGRGRLDCDGSCSPDTIEVRSERDFKKYIVALESPKAGFLFDKHSLSDDKWDGIFPIAIPLIVNDEMRTMDLNGYDDFMCNGRHYSTRETIIEHEMLPQCRIVGDKDNVEITIPREEFEKRFSEMTGCKNVRVRLTTREKEEANESSNEKELSHLPRFYFAKRFITKDLD